RKQAEEALRKSEAKYRQMFENVQDLFYQTDLQGTIVEISPSVERYGYTRERLMGTSVLDIYEDPEERAAFVKAMMERGEVTDHEIRLKAGDDRVIAGSVSARLFHDSDGNPAGFEGTIRDVTERKQAEEALRASEVKYRTIFESVQDIFYRTDETGTLTELSPSVARYGYTPEELIGTSVLDIYADPEERTQVVTTLIEREEITDYEISLKTADGRVIAVSLNARLRRHPDGTFAGSEGSIRDVTERKRADEALRASEERYRWLIESAPDAMVVADGEGRIVLINTETEKLFGYNEDDLLGRPIELLIPERFRAAHGGHRAGYLADHEARSMGAGLDHLVGRCKDGSEFPVEISLSPLHTDEGILVTATIRDITERKRVEEALRESESQFRTLAETISVAVLIFQGAKMRYVNSAAEELSGYTREELLTMNFWDTVHPEFQEQSKERGLARQRGERVAAEREVKIVTKAGQKRWVEFHLSETMFEGEPATLAAAFDITERKQMGEALERALRAERERARRDPLTGVLNHAAIVQELRDLIAQSGDAVSHTVAMVDVDGLKALNDTYGHQLGDAALINVAKAMSRDGALVGRYGGDEFVAILPDTDRPAAERYRQGVIDALAASALRDKETGNTVPVVASIGLAVYPEGAHAIADLISLADSAMYAVKRQRHSDSTGRTVPQSLGDARAAEMVGEIVPLLTSPGDLNDKFQLVAHRLSVGAGYDAVNFALVGSAATPPAAASTFAKVPDELVESWNRDQRTDTEPHPLRLLLERTGRPIILDDPQNDERVSDSQRQLLRAADIRSALVAPMLWEDRLVGMLSVASKREGAFAPRDVQFVAAIAAHVAAIVRMATLVDELQSTSARLAEAQDETVVLLAAAAEAHDQTTGLHLRGVRALTEQLAGELGYSEEGARELGLAAVLHDIGKIRVPDAVLSSSGPLVDEEWGLMQHHTTWGAQFLAGRPGFELAATIARSHHERWDGSGYPDGLSGEAIPEAATIIAVADSFDAMTNDRPYRKRRSVTQAVKEIVACSGEQFNPKVVEALLRLRKRRLLPQASPRSAKQAA
ncbi:MAG: PAS domain S-box protein, partial [Chloroflexi bacterium]|nr:PAS domain S-box protein [Chloroflexota bacterium]